MTAGKPLTKEHLQKLIAGQSKAGFAKQVLSRKANGKPWISEEQKLKMSRTHKLKLQDPAYRKENTARLGSGMLGKQQSERYKAKVSGENNYQWLSDADLVTQRNYPRIHERIKKRYGKADRCENPDCRGVGKRFEWSNKDHKYTLLRIDWWMLCSACHRAFDKTLRDINK